MFLSAQPKQHVILRIQKPTSRASHLAHYPVSELVPQLLAQVLQGRQVGAYAKLWEGGRVFGLFSQVQSPAAAAAPAASSAKHGCKPASSHDRPLPMPPRAHLQQQHKRHS